MTDLENTKKLLDGLGIKYEERIISEEEHEHYREEYKPLFNLNGVVLKCEADKQPDSKIIGYWCFYTEFVFSKTGDFVVMGIWE